MVESTWKYPGLGSNPGPEKVTVKPPCEMGTTIIITATHIQARNVGVTWED